MASITLSIILIGGALLQFIGQSDSFAAAEWFLMSRHGECLEIQSLKRKAPDLGEVRDLSMLSSSCVIHKGYQVTVNEVSTPNGTAAEVKVSEREPSLMFVTLDVCQQSGKE